IEEEQPENGHAILISYDFWQSRFGGSTSVLGRTLTLNEVSYTIIGVLRPDYRHPEPLFDQKAELWRPLTLKEMGDSVRHYLRVIGRLNPGVTLEQAQSEMTTIAERLEETYPATNKGWGANVVALHRQVTGNISAALLILQGAVGFVLLIACGNVANLLLAQAAARRKEMAIRSALGAGPSRLITQSLTESLLLAVMGGAFGLLLAFLAVHYLV